MAKDIEIAVGELHTGLHEDLAEMLGEQYEETIRAEMWSK
jgi:hypothetical protein